MSIIQVLGVGGLSPAPDSFSSFLRAALPFNLQFQLSDQSYKVRSSGAASSVYNYYDFGPTNAISIETAQFKFYGSSVRKPLGADDNVYRESFLAVDTGSGNPIGTGDFCVELWFYTGDFSFNGKDRLGIIFPYSRNGGASPVSGNPQAGGYVPYIVLLSDTWGTPGDRRKIRVTNPEETVTICTSSVLSPNTWYHMAFTRSGSTNRIFIDGVQQGSGTSSINFTGYEYWFFSSTEWLSSGFYSQDLRIYTGSPKYTTGFTAPGPMFI